MGRLAAGLAVPALLAIAGGCAARGAAEGMGEGEAEGEGDGRGTVARIVSRVAAIQTGSATIALEPDAERMTVSVSLRGTSTSSNVYAWRVTSGTCGVSAGALIGGLSDYPVIQMRQDGTGRADAELPTDRASARSVRIYDGSARVQLACGDFR